MGLLDFTAGKLAPIPEPEPVKVTPVSVEPIFVVDAVTPLQPEPTDAAKDMRTKKDWSPDERRRLRAEFKKKTGVMPEAFLAANPQINDDLVAEAKTLLTKQGRKKALYSSARDGEGNDNWGTPNWLYDLLNRNLGPFTVDACADAENTKVPGSYFDEKMDGLKQTWTGIVWCNPPYSGVADWVKKGYDSVYADKTADRVVLLVANRTETNWFHEYAAKGLVFFLRSRVKFVEPKDLNPLVDPETGKVKKRSSPTFGSMVIVFDRNLAADKFQQIPGGQTLMAVSVDWRSKQKVKP